MRRWDDDEPKTWTEVAVLVVIILALGFALAKCEDVCVRRCEAQGHDESYCAMKCFR